MKSHQENIMLLPDNIHPDNTIYYNAIYLIQCIQTKDRFTFDELLLQTRQLKDMSMAIFILCLDWLFLLNFIQLDDDGNISKCL